MHNKRIWLIWGTGLRQKEEASKNTKTIYPDHKFKTSPTKGYKQDWKAANLLPT